MVDEITLLPVEYRNIFFIYISEILLKEKLNTLSPFYSKQKGVYISVDNC